MSQIAVESRDMNNKPRSILIIDDEEAIILLLKTIFGLQGYTSYSCTQPANAVEMAIERQPDLVVLDIAMPGKDGYEICQELKTTAKTRNIPIVMLTALALNQDRKKGIESGADSFIFKPFDPQTLISEISRLLG